MVETRNWKHALCVTIDPTSLCNNKVAASSVDGRAGGWNKVADKGGVSGVGTSTFQLADGSCACAQHTLIRATANFAEKPPSREENCSCEPTVQNRRKAKKHIQEPKIVFSSKNG